MSVVFEQVRDKYFSDDEWEKMPDAEKNRHKLMYENYTNCDEEYRFLMPVPEFLKNKTPEFAAKKRREREKRRVDDSDVFRKPLFSVKSFEEIRKNPIRRAKLKPVNYEEVPEPDDDRYVFCDKCDTDNVDFCKKCGVLRLRLIIDKKVAMGVEDRAKKTLPSCMEIRDSPIHNLGVFAKEDLENNLQMGPYEGLVTDKDNAEGYSWKLNNGTLVNGMDEKNSNWLRYVNCARHVNEQNIIAFQYRGKLYYRTFRNIKKGEELLVYYGLKFATELGIKEKNYFDANQNIVESNTKKTIKEIENKIDYLIPREEKAILDYYKCKYCFWCFTTEDFKLIHMKRCKSRNDKVGETFDCVYSCKHCLIQFFKKKLCSSHEKKCLKPRVRVEKEKLFECDMCPKKYKMNHHLLEHEKYAHKKEELKQFKCKKCEFVTVRKGDFNIHMNIHNKKKYFKCNFCQYSAARLSYLNGHLLSKHKLENERENIIKISSKIYKCSKCLYSTVRKSSYDTHTKVCLKIKNVKTYECHICHYTTIRKSHLNAHKKTHNKIKELKCSICKFQSNKKQDLDNHILSKHSDLLNKDNTNLITSKVHACQHCNYKTTHKGALKNHLHYKH